MRDRGFTFIELMAVVAVLGVVAGAGVFAMTGQLRHASRAEALDRIAHNDAMARAAARRLGEPYVLRFDLDRQTVSRGPAATGSDAPTTTRSLPRAARIARMRLPDAAGNRLRGAVRNGVVTVPVSIDGRSTTYALDLVEADVDPRDLENPTPDQARPWIIFAGLTGQASPRYDDREIDNLFAALERRLDAD